MIGALESLLAGIVIGYICGTCIGICCFIIKNHKDSINHQTDVENITKNILHTLDEETGSNVDYMTARPIL
jgi:TM2 domain-containing membrane protein YozV